MNANSQSFLVLTVCGHDGSTPTEKLHKLFQMLNASFSFEVEQPFNNYSLQEIQIMREIGFQSCLVNLAKAVLNSEK